MAYETKANTIKCSFCLATVEAPGWPDIRPHGWNILPGWKIVCPDPKHEGGFDATLEVPT